MTLATNSLYFRNHELIVGPKVTATSSSNVEPTNAISFKNRVTFKITKTTTPEPVKAEITLYNIKQDSRNFLEQKDLLVFLKIGYGEELTNIFTGDVRRREVKRSGPDITYALECGDSEIIINNALIKISLGANATNTQILKEIRKQLGLSKGVTKGFTEKNYTNGFAFFGLASELLTNLTKNLGLEWNVQDGELRILPVGETDGEEAIVISPESGLLGFPTKTIDGLKFRCLAIPQLRPGRAVKVISKQFTGEIGPNSTQIASAALVESGDIVKVRRVDFVGDTRGSDWYADVEAVIPRLGAL